MKSRTSLSLISILVSTILISANLAAQDATAAAKKAQHHHYKLIDIGTFGGSGSFFSNGNGLVDNSVGLNRRGVAWGDSATSIPSTPTSNVKLACNGGDAPTGFVMHAFRWQEGIVADLGALPGNSNCSAAMASNNRGETVGISENGDVDPLTGVNQTRAVRWKDGVIEDLGSLGGNQNEALGMNNRGEIVGWSLNTVPDSYSPIDAILGSFNGTQTRAVLWQHGQMRDLGTLGTGNDALAGLINERGQIAGISFTTATANPDTGIPTLDPFFWEDGKMVDIGSVGGAIGFTMAMNNNGQVIGVSSVATDPGACLFGLEGNSDCHPFLWQHGTLIDLHESTVGGNPLVAYGMNDAGEVVGIGAFPNSTDAFLWENGAAIDLGHLSDCGSFANAINSHRQVVGGTFSCQDGTHARAFLWEKGSIIDLNSVIPTNSPLHLAAAYGINDRGEIAGEGLPPGVPPADLASQGHAFLLIPCDDDHPSDEGCDYSMVDAEEVANDAVAPQAQQVIPLTMNSLPRTISPSQNWFKQRYRILGQRPPLSH